VRILHVNTSDINGGAAIAAHRLHQGLVAIGVDSIMLVQKKNSDDYRVIGPASKPARALARLRVALNDLPLHCYRNRKKIPFSSSWMTDRLLKNIRQLQPDIVHLHWIAGGFLRIETLAKIQKPIVWTLHDMWGFTGGCHYDEGCGRYEIGCGACPSLGSDKRHDLAYRVWRRKRKAWHCLKLTVVTPSRWLADCVKASKLLGGYHVEIIPNGLDLTKYKPIDKFQARLIWGLPQDKKLILFGALNATMDIRKGFGLLQCALQRMAAAVDREQYRVVIFGASEPKQIPNLGFDAYYLGRLHDDVSLAVLYSAVDVMCVPSRQEAFGQTASEAMACGTPVVAFGYTGLSDIVEHGKNGYLAMAFDIEDFANCIGRVLSDRERHQTFSQATREKAKREFEITQVAGRYVEVYKGIEKI